MEQHLSTKELAKRLDVKESTIRSWVFKKEIPFLKINRLVRFRESAIQKWLGGKERRINERH
jgi:excisionase family DNA binding protein